MHHQSPIQILCHPSSRLLLLLILVFVSIMLAVHKSSSLKCFQCKDHDNKTHVDVSPDACRKIEPPTTYVECQSPPYVCMKTVANGVSNINGRTHNMHVVRRNCFDNSVNNYTVGICHSLELTKPFRATVCFCDDRNYCNRGLTLVCRQATIMMLGILFVTEIL